MFQWTCSKLKRGALALVLALTGFTAGNAAAQELAVAWDPRSGDAWVDTWLGDMNRYGARYPEPFIDEMVRYHNAPRALVVDLLETRRWAPGDVYYACALASVIGRPCRHVVDRYEANRGEGWGVVAQELGIKPGSPEFHRLKKGFVPTYDRWARPIELDDDLRREFPNRGRSKSATGFSKAQKGNAAEPGKPAKPGRSPANGKAPARGTQGQDGNGKKGKGNDKGG